MAFGWKPGGRTDCARRASEHFWPWLREALPDLYPSYQRLYGARSHAQREFRLEMAERFTRVRDRVGLEGAPHRLEARRKVEPSQLALAL